MACNFGTKLALIVDMESAHKDEREVANRNMKRDEEVGLSSAMHDIRMLSSEYASKSSASDPGDSLHLDAVMMQPPPLLLSADPRHRLDWKVPALLVLMLFGLSTSALALSLYTSSEAPPKPVFFQTLDSSQVVAPMPGRVSYEAPLFESAIPMEAAPIDAAPIVRTVAPKQVRRMRARRVERKASSCDEVSCLLDASDPCCAAFANTSTQNSEVREAYLPYRPKRSAVMRAMKSIEPAVLRCFDTHGESGIASVSFVIAAEGHVNEVQLGKGTLGFRACVRNQVKTLSFDPLQRPFKMSFPYLK